ncbi:TolB family protein [Plantactinospora endophytica]|uniref:WD40 repeat domain-containing protein n=1 Tax=Plantactinospora endophytica TaxID=673535 RepID=A0ABQ4DSW7_9ACTN|nr:hypothetical protein [Plantactinospora endophytica]GIG85558.1 hypothetical protein Pen02_04940 [Plantactinospora endophytica]
MTTDLDRRIIAGLRGVADEPLVVPPPAERLRARAARSGTRVPAAWRRPVLAAVAVLVLLAGVALAPALRPGGGSAPAGLPDAPTLPARFAGMSLLTAPVSKDPPGPAVALYRQGTLGTRVGTSQVLVLGVDGRTYRRLDLAERRGAEEADGEWSAASALLSPDGSQVVVADDHRVSGRVEIVDLRTGRVREIAFDPPAILSPLAWAPDGSRVVFRLERGPFDSRWQGYRLAVLDVPAGRLGALGEYTSPDSMLGAAVSPDGTLLAVSSTSGSPTSGRIDLLDFTGAVRRTLALPEGYHLTGVNAWSPDGRLLVVQHLGAVSGGFAFVDPTGGSAPVPAPLPGLPHPAELLGWSSPDTLLVGMLDGDYEIRRTPVDGSAARTVATISDGPGGPARVNQLRLADGLLADLRVVDDPGGPERGPQPWWWRVLVTVAVALLGWLVFRTVRRRSARRRRPSGSRPGPSGAPNPDVGQP